MRHEICPSTMTIESLADWIRSNKVDVFNHEEKINLTEDEINEFQKSSSLASRAIDKLKGTMKYIQETIKNGTPFDNGTMDHRPVSVTIPPTKGLKALEANRKFADEQLENGYKMDITTLYLLPWPEFKKMVAVDIEGNEWTKYSRDMSLDEYRQHGRPILEATEEVKEILEENGMKITKAKGNTVKIEKVEETPKPKKNYKDKEGRPELDLLADEDTDGNPSQEPGISEGDD
jgi:hypothetical protein